MRFFLMLILSSNLSFASDCQNLAGKFVFNQGSSFEFVKEFSQVGCTRIVGLSRDQSEVLLDGIERLEYPKILTWQMYVAARVEDDGSISYLRTRKDRPQDDVASELCNYSIESPETLIRKCKGLRTSGRIAWESIQFGERL